MHCSVLGYIYMRIFMLDDVPVRAQTTESCSEGRGWRSSLYNLTFQLWGSLSELDIQLDATLMTYFKHGTLLLLRWLRICPPFLLITVARTPSHAAAPLDPHMCQPSLPIHSLPHVNRRRPSRACCRLMLPSRTRLARRSSPSAILSRPVQSEPEKSHHELSGQLTHQWAIGPQIICR